MCAEARCISQEAFHFLFEMCSLKLHACNFSKRARLAGESSKDLPVSAYLLSIPVL